MSFYPSSNYKRCILEFLMLLVVLGLAAGLRFTNLAENPGWYADEGSNLIIAQNLARGHVQYMAIRDSTFLFARLPVFELILAAILSVWDVGLLALRALCAGLGVLTVAALYGVVRRIEKSALLALLAAGALAIYPHAVIYNRLGFGYNLLAPLVLVVYWAGWEYLASSHRGWLALASLAIGVGGISDLWMFSLVVPLAIAVWMRRRRNLVWCLLLAGLPFALYAAWMLASVPHAFWFDLGFTFSRLGRLPPADQISTLGLNYTILVSSGFWIPLGCVGLFLLRDARARGLAVLLFFVPIVLLGRTVSLHGLSFYYNIPLLPLVALGVASAAWRGVPCLARAAAQALPRWLAVSILTFAVTVPFVTTGLVTARQARDGFSTEIDPALVRPSDARQAAGYVNSRARPGDLTLASPGVAWLVQADVADYQMAVAAAGQATSLLPGNIPPERLAYDPRLERARFVIVDNLWRNVAAWDVPGVRAMIERVSAWPLVFKAGEIEVYCNPDLFP